MTDTRNTDERLRYYLNNRQPDRERMCLALLRLDKSFTQIEPRRPEGGPDGARDLQCVFKNEKCFGAVGFKNNANDSAQHKREITKKFKSDLTEALKVEPSLKSFIFLTNVDLPDKDLKDLKEYARNLKLNHVEIFHRERLRILLDSVEGYAIRLSFLDINLSDAEQKTFFSRFGDAIQDLIVGKLDSVEQRMEEIQYRNWMRGRCRSITVTVNLKEFYRIEGIEHEPYRFALRLHRVLSYGEGVMLLGCYSKISNAENRADFEVKRFAYIDTGMLPTERKAFKHFPSGTRCLFQPFDSISFGIALENRNSITSDYGFDIAELGQYAIDFYCDAGWAHLVKSVEVYYDDYLVNTFVNNGEHLRPEESKHGIPFWPEEASSLVDRPVQFWSSIGPFLDQRTHKRKRIRQW